jgi:glycosyltransferase involved in cell wall biosynthesis
MPMKKLVSVLIPAYNAEKWIGETITSAINQTWPNTEIIIVDDGSKDDTYNIASKYESKDVKVITQENRGACSARNTALASAQGDYIQWLDADDILAPDKIFHQLTYNNEDIDPDILLTSSFGTFYYSTKRARFTPHHLWQDLSPVEYLVFKFNEKVWMSLAVFLVSRKMAENAGPWNEKLTRDDDGEYFCRVVTVSKSVKFIPDAKCYYRLGNISLSKNITLKAIESSFLSIDLCIQHLLSLEDSKRTRSASLTFLQYFMPYIYPNLSNPVQSGILNKMNIIAEELGGKLHPPSYKWKYKFIKNIFGGNNADKIKYIMWRINEESRKRYDMVYHLLS